MPKNSISVVPTGKKICKPFLLEVMVFSPESGYKFKVIVERSCTPQADAIWKLVFDLYRVGTTEVQLVHVSFTAGTAVESKTIELMASEGVKPEQAEVLVNEVHPAAKDIEGVAKPSPKQKERLRKAMAHVVSVEV